MSRPPGPKAAREIKALRVANGLSQARFASLLHYAESTIRGWEREASPQGISDHRTVWERILEHRAPGQKLARGDIEPLRLALGIEKGPEFPREESPDQSHGIGSPPSTPPPVSTWTYDLDRHSDRAGELVARVEAANAALRQGIAEGLDPASTAIEALQWLKDELTPIIGLHAAFSFQQLSQFCETVLTWKHFVNQPDQVEEFQNLCFWFADPGQLDIKGACEKLDDQHIEMKRSHELLRNIGAAYSIVGAADRVDYVRGIIKDIDDTIQENRQARQSCALFFFESLGQLDNSVAAHG